MSGHPLAAARGHDTTRTRKHEKDMYRFSSWFRGLVISCSLVVGLPRVALACPVCFGQNDSPLATAMNAGILAMLGVVVGVLGCFGAFFIHLMKRAKLGERLDADQLAHERISGHRLSGTDPQEGTASCCSIAA